MSPQSAALLLLSAAALAWSPARVVPGRLALVTGRSTTPRWPRGLSTGTLLPTALAVTAGALVAVVVAGPGGVIGGLVTGCGCLVLARRLLRPGGRRSDPGDQLAMAATWDLLAACLVAGLPVPTAVRAVAGEMTGAAGAALLSVADLLALGADPAQAWSPALACQQTAELARCARRTARSGTALAAVARDLAVGVRDRAGDLAEARAQRAAVLITGPLGLCFLPAFVCLGIVPVVAGLAGQLTVHL